MDYAGQTGTFVITVVTGCLLGLLFDVYRIGRGVLRPHWVITSLADLLYWLLATAIVFVALLLGNWGEVRLYVFIGLLTGVLLYYRLLSRSAVRLMIAVIRIIARIARAVRLFFLYTFVKPVRWAVCLAFRPVRAAHAWVQKRRPPDANIPPQ
ncbi:MAG TPA: spore cortex biosynthesis protein YabQ [Selenomonadales bacterium]|nr:spore cortex biosynthesis protein YabQ [Selenomonadales bacterium]